MTPILFQWTDDAKMAPQPRFLKLCDEQFAVGEIYRMEVIEERSRISHNHFFASVEEAWRNLPEGVAEQFPTSHHLRKYALIKAGFCDQNSVVCSSAEEALRVAAFIKPIDPFRVVVVRNNVVTIYNAKSQSTRAMGKDDFQRSKQNVLEIVAHMVGVASADLNANAGASA